MFDRFTDRARKVMGLSRQAAQRLNHDYIGTEHILLGFLEEGSGVGAEALRRLRVDLGRVRGEVRRLVPPGTAAATTGMMPFTPGAKRVLEGSLAEASDLGHTYIGTEHLLLGLLREREGTAAQALANLHVAIEDVRREVTGLVGTEEPGRERREGHASAGSGDRDVRVPPEGAARRVLRHVVSHLLSPEALRTLSEELGLPEGKVEEAIRRTVERFGPGSPAGGAAPSGGGDPPER